MHSFAGNRPGVLLHVHNRTQTNVGPRELLSSHSIFGTTLYRFAACIMSFLRICYVLPSVTQGIVTLLQSAAHLNILAVFIILKQVHMVIVCIQLCLNNEESQLNEVEVGQIYRKIHP